MDWQARYAVSRTLSLGVSPRGRLVATNSISRPPKEIDFDALPVLLAFGGGASAHDALQRVREEWDAEEVGFSEAVSSLIEQNYLTPTDADGAVSLATSGFASPTSHHGMLRDEIRVDTYRSAIERHCSGKRVLEIGCGTGVLSLFAARAGAVSVDAIEESTIAAVAETMFDANAKLGVPVRLHRGNSRDVTLETPAEVLIHELFGTDPFDENVLPALADARGRLLAPNGRMLPQRLDVGCVGVDPGNAFIDREKMLGEARAYAARYGLDFEPWFRYLGDATTEPMRSVLTDRAAPPTVLTAECPLFTINFETDDLGALTVVAPPSLIPNTTGSIRALWIYFRAWFDDEIVLSTAPDAAITHWGRDVRSLRSAVEAVPGTPIPLDAQIESPFGRQRLRIDLAPQPSA